MRPKKYSFTPAATDADGLADDVTAAAGVAFALAATTAGDNLAHLIIITPSGSVTGNYSLTGTDADGNAKTETLATDTTNAVTSANHFKTLTSVLAPAGIGSETVDIGWTQVAVSKTIPLDWRQNDFQVSLGLDISGTINFTVQHTLDAVQDTQPSTLKWFNHSSIASSTADVDGNYSFPVQATRLLVNTVSAGATVDFLIVQG
jgi:hypothetical protein